MTRPILILSVSVLTFSLGSGAWWLTRRNPGAPPQEEVLQPFRAGTAGAGQLIELQPPPAPLRSLRWTAPLPGGAAVAQILTQTGRQQVTLFLQGEPGSTFTLSDPAGVSGAFFSFADLVDAALAPGDALVLLYRGAGNPSAPSLILAWDLQTQQIRWSHRAPGEHLALSPDRRSVFLFGPGTPVSILNLAAGRAKAQSASVDLPPEVKEISSLLPSGARSFLVAHALGLSIWRNGEWTHVPTPPPSPLGFNTGLGRLAGNAKVGWWQPEPGMLLPLGPDGRPQDPLDLKALFPESARLDASLLRLLGEDPDGYLWFGLAYPSLPSTTVVQEATQPVLQTPPPSPEMASSVPTAPAPLPPREVWEAHLKRGLDRIYRWKPGAMSMTVLTWAEAWKTLDPPPGIPQPTGDGGLRPEAGVWILGSPERVWWLPLRAVQPR